MVTKKEEHFEIFSYAIGIASIVFGILQPFLGLGLGITGLFLLGKSKTEMARKARKLNIIGIVVAVAVSALLGFSNYYALKSGLLGNAL
jgi:hypothetical protein